MAYKPKRLVNNNLYTSGGEYYDAVSGKVYTGPYHQDYNGTSYTGATPNDPNRRPLVLNPTTQKSTTNIISSTANSNYTNLNPKNLELIKFGKDPQPQIAIPTPSDYDNGSLVRYFAYRITEKPASIREISAEAFNSINSKDGEYNYSTWKVTSLIWKITGEETQVETTNTKTVIRVNANFRGLSSYLSDRTQFLKKDVNLVDSVEPRRTFNQPPRRTYTPAVPQRSKGGGGGQRPISRDETTLRRPRSRRER